MLQGFSVFASFERFVHYLESAFKITLGFGCIVTHVCHVLPLIVRVLLLDNSYDALEVIPLGPELTVKGDSWQIFLPPVRRVEKISVS